MIRQIAITLTLFAANLAHGEVPYCDVQLPNQSQVDCRYTSPGAWTEPEQIEWSRDIRGMRSGIVNLYVHGKLDDLSAALTTAGWTQALDQNHLNNSAYLKAAAKFQLHKIRIAEMDRLRKILKQQQDQGQDTAQTQAQLQDVVSKDSDLVQSMPISNETLCGKTQAIAFESENNPVGGRHHLRIFATGRLDAAGLEVWAIVANRDTGIMFDIHRANQGFLNHRIEANADYERDKVLVDLMIGNRLASAPVFKRLALTCPAPADKAFSKDDIAVEIEIRSSSK